MYCHKCGKENHENSKFCHSCGVSLKEESLNYGEKKNITKNFKIKWRSPIVLIIISLIIIGGLVYGGIKTYAYYKVESKISTAEKLQKNKDYAGSLNILNELNSDSNTDNQKIKINKLKGDNKNFSDYKTLFDTNVIKINSSATIDDLKSAQTNLQSIDSIYPDYESVRNKLSELNTLLLTALENDSAANKALAEKNKKDAASAQASKDKAINDAKVQVSAEKQKQIYLSFYNQISKGYSDYLAAVSYFNDGMSDENDGNHSLALISFAKANSLFRQIQSLSDTLDNTFSNMPQSYIDASNSLYNAAYYSIKSANSAINEEGASNTNINGDIAYKNIQIVKKFLDSNY